MDVNLAARSAGLGQLVCIVHHGQVRKFHEDCNLLLLVPSFFLSRSLLSGFTHMHSIVSFGAPVPNEYRLVVEGQAPVSIQTAQVSGTSTLFCTPWVKLNVPIH